MSWSPPPFSCSDLLKCVDWKISAGTGKSLVARWSAMVDSMGGGAWPRGSPRCEADVLRSERPLVHLDRGCAGLRSLGPAGGSLAVGVRRFRARVIRGYAEQDRWWVGSVDAGFVGIPLPYWNSTGRSVREKCSSVIGWEESTELRRGDFSLGSMSQGLHRSQVGWKFWKSDVGSPRMINAESLADGSNFRKQDMRTWGLSTRCLTSC